MSNPPPPSPINYQTPEPRQARIWYPLSVAAVVYFVGISILIIMNLVVPHFKQTLLDFKTELPGITKLLLSFSNSMTNSGIVVFWIAFIVGIPALVGLARNGRPLKRNEILLVWLIVLIVWVLFIIAVVIALFAPMFSLIQAVNGPVRHR